VKTTEPPPEFILIDPIPVPPVCAPLATPRKNSAKRGQVVAETQAVAPNREFNLKTLFPLEVVLLSFVTVNIAVPVTPVAAVVEPIIDAV
jgi:hypothetical protein